MRPPDRFLTAAARIEAEELAAALMPPREVDLNRWAAENLVFGEAESPFPGRYDPDRFPFYRRILEVLAPEDPSRVVAFRKSAQIGGTVVAQIFLGASMDLDPCAFMYVHPTVDNASRWALTKWRPMIRATPALQRFFRAEPSKDAKNKLLFQERLDGRGQLQLSGAKSPNSLSMVSMKRQVQDDLAKWETNSAGDPELQADSRSKAFEEAKIFKVSTPMIADGCRITKDFLGGTQEHFHVPCPQCGHCQPLDWENMRATIDEAKPETVCFSCVECNFPIEEHHRSAIVAQGRWVAHNPAGQYPSFHMWAAYAGLERWETIARTYLASRGDPGREQAFENDTLGLAFEIAGEAPDWQGLKDRAAASGRISGIIPDGAGLVTLTFDCQDDWVAGALIGWGSDLRRWVIARIVVEGHISEPETRAALNGLVERQWPTAAGGAYRADLVGIDGNAWTGDVFDWVKDHRESRVLMVRGVPGEDKPILDRIRKEKRRDGTTRKYGHRFFNVGVDGVKGALYRMLRVDRPGARGFIDFPNDLADDYFEELTAERRQQVTDRKGFTRPTWVKPRGRRNEQLDCMVYGEALSHRLGWKVLSARKWEELVAKVQAPASAVADAPVAKAEPTPVDIGAVVAGPQNTSVPPPVAARTQSEIRERARALMRRLSH